MQELWAEVKDFPDYIVNPEGKVQNVITGYSKVWSINQQGFPHVLLMRDGKQFRRTVSHLVAEAFLPAPEAPHFDSVINVDGDRLNCRRHNLLWRPRWFAIRYNRQMEHGFESKHRRAVIDIDTGERFNTPWEVVLTYGVLLSDVFYCTANHVPVFPTNKRYRFDD